jgi:carbon-monoxide dehydrogenase medium subunit
MRPFAYEAPTTVRQAVELLTVPGHKARPLAGGTDLLVQLRHRLVEVDAVVDLKRIPELTQVSCRPDAGLVIGAAASCARLCESLDVQEQYPGLIDAASIIGGPAIRERATLGGNLCNAAPSGDTIPAMIVLGAMCVAAGPDGTRTLPVETFCTGPGQTVLAPSEILVSIHIEPPPPRSGAAYLRFIPRGEMDIAVAGVGAWVALNEQGTQISEARIALAAVAPTPCLASDAAAALVGAAPAEPAFARAAELAQQAASPITDVRGTAAQRRHLVGVLTRRALRTAVQRAVQAPGIAMRRRGERDG